MRDRASRKLSGLLLAAVLLAGFAVFAGEARSAGAPTATRTDPNALVRPQRMDQPPPGRRLTGNQAAAIAARAPKIIAERRRHPGSFPNVFLKGPGRWQVSFYDRSKPPKEIAQAYVDDVTGRVTEAWTGPQVAWTMARGYPGAFGRKVNSPWVWIPLTVLFVAPFVDLRRPLRLLHLDLLALAAFGVSVAFFNDANIDVSVPLAYPLLVYLLGRMLWIGLRRRDRAARERLHLNVPVAWLAVALVFLVGFRVGLNVTNSNVIDVGYAGVIGADRLAGGHPLWNHFPPDNQHGDTYGPVAYAAYVPAEQAFPWSGRWDDLAAAHAAAIAFDLACMLLLWLIGRRIRGPGLGVVLAYAWAAFPFTLYALDTNVNDALVAALVLGALWTAGSPAGRGAFVALAGMAKFAPLALAPLFATQGPRRGTRSFAIAFGAVVVASLLVVVAYGGLRPFYDRTLGFQASRGSPFSLWGLYGWTTAQTVVQSAAVVLAVAVALVRRRPDVVGLGALTAAVLIALQLGVTHWFYLYIVWFFGPVMVALLGRNLDPQGPLTPLAAATARAPAPPHRPAAPASIG
jgi:Glycosyltransferase family 87